MGLRDWAFDKGLDSMKQKYVGAILRAGLIGIGAVTARDVDNGQIEQLAGAIIAIATVGWSMYEKRQTRAVLVTGLAAANMTEDDAHSRVANPLIQSPSVNTPPNVIPTLTLSEVERFTRPA